MPKLAAATRPGPRARSDATTPHHSRGRGRSFLHWAYIAKDSPGAADRFLRRLNERMERLPQAPHVGERQDQYRAGLRSIVEGSYVIFYEVSATKVSIYRVLHGARDLKAIFEKSGD
ncbi:MAG: type II toxin-antitoxin system RelE/ParE family toxin [Pirellulales bacterium]|nr:type II toxin-antitoxin system RelE/ParE family toxin [Pirellulales bacterium]